MEKHDRPFVPPFRVDAFHIIVEIQEDRVVALVVRISHRKRVYGGH